MRAQDLEPEMEELLLRLVPDLATQWQGATEDEIEQIERISVRPLPRFYRWFLMRMGRSMGPITYRSLNFSASKVIECYAEVPVMSYPRFLIIGHESDEMLPLHLLYDFKHPARDDAQVTRGHLMVGAILDQFETFREMIAWGKFLTWRVDKCPQRCEGSLVNRGGDVLALLDPVMKSLGFKTPIPTGPCCALYETTHAAMVTSTTPGNDTEHHGFYLGGSDAGRLRRILGEITTESSLELKIYEWEPPLA